LKYRIEVKKSAAKELKRIHKPDQKRISIAIDNLAENLPDPDATKMKGTNPFHKIRVGNYRIIVSIHLVWDSANWTQKLIPRQRASKPVVGLVHWAFDQ